MKKLDPERARLFVEAMPPRRFDAICTEECVPEEVIRQVLYADTMTIAYMTIDQMIAEGKPDPLADLESYRVSLEASIRNSIRDANEKVRPLREALLNVKSLKRLDA